MTTNLQQKHLQCEKLLGLGDTKKAWKQEIQRAIRQHDETCTVIVLHYNYPVHAKKGRMIGLCV